ncbi:MAG: acetyl-CoA hydrolase/transferase C-terminal domain-containing protein [Acidobacteriota bacterium]
MGWIDIYQQRKRSLEEAAGLLASGTRIYVSGNSATPLALLEAVARRVPELRDIEVVHVLLLGDDPLSRPEAWNFFRHNSLFVGSTDRLMVNEGLADYVPVHLHEIPRLFSEGILPLDAALIQTSPPDEHGFLSLGVECLATMSAVANARTVIAQVNQRMPRTLGDCFVHVARVHAVVEADQELPELQRSGFGEIERRIGGLVAELVEDGCTLQLGIGAIPDAVLASLGSRRDLGIHTEMVSDGIMEGVEAGVITGAQKTLHKGKVIGTFALGSRRLYDYLHNNPLFEFHPVDYTNDPAVIARNDRMVAINSAIEVDLTGQVCSDSIGSRIYSGFGGQVDFVRGAAHSRGGRSIIALPSTALDGQVSRITAALKPGAGVVTTRADVHYVVTEFGIAKLRGRNLRQRAEALIAIAHPDFREQLMEAAWERRLIPHAVPVAELPPETCK